jgi:antitoxin (DNA-binding transcriptional repressor) of toxin-antitoxin stability system
MVNNMTMNKVNIHEAKAKLSEYVDAVLRGEQVVICRRNRPVAELRAVAVVRTKPRPIGGAQDRLTIPSTFFDPLPDDVVDPFYEEPQQLARSAPRVAERRATYRAATKRPPRK